MKLSVYSEIAGERGDLYFGLRKRLIKRWSSLDIKILELSHAIISIPSIIIGNQCLSETLNISGTISLNGLLNPSTNKITKPSKKIKITEDQQQFIKSVKSEWDKLKTTTRPAVRDKAEKYISAIYTSFGKIPPKFFWASSPREANIISFLLRNKKSITKESVMEISATGKIPKYFTTYTLGNMESYWIPFLKLPSEILGTGYSKEVLEKIENWYQVSQTCGWWYPEENVCICCDRPLTFYTRVDNCNILHKDRGAAISYADGWEVFVLNGILVPKHIAMTPSERLDPHLIEDVNLGVDVRAQIMKKIGAEQVLRKCKATLIDKKEFTDGEGTKHYYELINLELKDKRRRPYLRMINPSVPGMEHVEGVPPDTKTVEEALFFRNRGRNYFPRKLT